tara:strand:- start:217 stop:684 length:468 start_codon:yes stop_codon:yes gene_type:complete
MMFADFEPGIFFLLLWGLLSWFSRRKKIITDSSKVIPKPKMDLFPRLQKLQENLSEEMGIFPPVIQPVNIEDDYMAEDNGYVFEEPEILEIKSEDLDGNKGFASTKEIKVSIKEHDNWLKKNLSQKSNLRKLIVLREALGDPRSLKPYTGDYFQS